MITRFRKLFSGCGKETKMRFKTIISVERVECHQVSNAALKESEKPGERGADSRDLVSEDLIRIDHPQDCLVLIVGGQASHCRLAVSELGIYQPGHVRLLNRILYVGDAEEWPQLFISLNRIGNEWPGETTLGQAVYRYRGNCALEWLPGIPTTYGGREVRPGLYEFAMQGNGGNYALFLRSAVLDCAFDI
jgi:hypothetical protein